MTICRFVVRGHVQNVGFRAYVKDLAEELDISGKVWNRQDGAVEMVAGHNEPHVLELFGLSLKRGPGRVESVDTENAPGAVVEPGFQISYSR